MHNFKMTKLKIFVTHDLLKLSSMYKLNLTICLHFPKDKKNKNAQTTPKRTAIT